MGDPYSYKASEEEELASAEYELNEVEAKIQSLKDRKEFLVNRIGKLKDSILLKKNEKLRSKNWASTDFPWSSKLEEVLKKVFKLNGFRPLQRETINAVLSGEDVILIMPTGGGKSLCYQLPALIKKGLTIVISPLVSLMEDQLVGLRKLDVNAAMLNANSSKEEVNSIQQSMTEKSCSLKLLYVTPEKLAKSKRFMTKLQKMYGMGGLALIAIDEVHCCSQWGHDFRPDYKFLGILKGMFPDVPLMGLTATSTSKVTVDVQKMLCIQGCLVLKASFNRPNLYYEVRTKASSHAECVAELVGLLQGRFSGKSGIIYTTAIKDCEQLMQELRKHNLRVGCYHANLEADLRSKVHNKWLTGEYQAVIATIAFGLGIDKPDVRFVIHHSLSKSMENFYQESGRAGRDNKRADCILMYRLADVFKLSGMVFTQQTGLENLYSIVAYCLDTCRCRRDIIASHFDEGWESKDCKAMCDHCHQPREKKLINITDYCRAVYKIISHAAGSDTKLTAQKLLDAWFGKGAGNLRVASVPVPKFTRETGENIVAFLLIEGYLQEDFHFTPYSTISYLKRGPRASAALSDNHKIMMTTRGALLPQNKISSEKSDNLKNSYKNQEVEQKKLNTSKGSTKVESLSKPCVASNSKESKNMTSKSFNKPPNSTITTIELNSSSDDDFQETQARSKQQKRKAIVLDSDSEGGT